MSILNVFITPEEGLIGVDSEGTFPDGSVGEYGKLVVAPAANAVVAFRGTDYVLKAAIANIVCFGGELEQMAGWLPDMLKGAVDYSRKNFQAQEEDLKLEMVLVGYSQAERGVVGHLFRRDVGSEEIRVDRIQNRFIAPYWVGGDVPAGLSDNRDGLCMLARSQSLLAREREPGFAAGGRYFIASVKRRSISIVQAFEFPRRACD